MSEHSLPFLLRLLHVPSLISKGCWPIQPCRRSDMMMFAMGVSGYGSEHEGLGFMASVCSIMFTHAFFKAFLFLGAGAIIHAVHSNYHERNGRIKETSAHHPCYFPDCLSYNCRDLAIFRIFSVRMRSWLQVMRKNIPVLYVEYDRCRSDCILYVPSLLSRSSGERAPYHHTPHEAPESNDHPIDAS